MRTIRIDNLVETFLVVDDKNKKIVNGFEDYEISTSGEVFSRKFGRWGGRKKLKKQVDKYGYYYVRLTCQKHRTVHRLVALNFIPNPKNKPQVNHKNGIKTDNHVSNLEWATSKENTLHACRTGLRKPHSNGGKISYETAKKIKSRRKNGERGVDLAKEFGLSPSQICAINKGRSWKKV